MDEYKNAIDPNEINSAEYKNDDLLKKQEIWARELYLQLLDDYKQNECRGEFMRWI